MSFIYPLVLVIMNKALSTAALSAVYIIPKFFANFLSPKMRISKQLLLFLIAVEYTIYGLVYIE